MTQETLNPAIFDFLRQLEQNNNREWFTAQKEVFREKEAQANAFFGALEHKMAEHDEIERLKVFRIYRDVRFSKDKTPYKTHFAASLSRLGAHLRGGYYVRLKPGETMLAAGFWNPNKEDLFRIRKEFELDADEFRKVINTPSFKKVWGELEGEGVKTAPKGFDKNHPAIDLIKKKQFIFSKSFTDEEVLGLDFLDEVNTSFKVIRPYFDLMSDILTTNLNGESLLG